MLDKSSKNSGNALASNAPGVKGQPRPTFRWAIQKGTPVSIHQQLVTQISLQIASGEIPAGTKLPSVRGLAQQLDVHYNTCSSVYQELSSLGMVETRRGSGVVVTDFKNRPHPLEKATEKPSFQQSAEAYFSNAAQDFQTISQDLDLRLGVQDYVTKGVAKGYSLKAIAQLFYQTLSKERPHIKSHAKAVLPFDASLGGDSSLPQHQKRIVFVDLHPDIIPLFEAELRYYLNEPHELINASRGSVVVEGISLEALAHSQKEDPALFHDGAPSLYLVSRFHYHRLQQLVGPEASIFVLDIESGRDALGLLKNLPLGSLVAIISNSSVILRMGEAMIQGALGHELLIRPVLFQEGWDEIRQVLNHASYVFGDFLCAPALSRETQKPVQTIRLVQASQIQNILDRLFDS
ncbi:MAG: GntR family transcriptional regulator [Cyanobacteria bacterium]|nr:GntR family transcriptional regulator [Cyanobacteriota bacterium]